MATSRTKDNHRRAAKDLALKLKAEAVLIKKLQPHFTQLKAQFVKEYASSGNVIDVDEHRKRIAKLLHASYLLVAMQFSIRMRWHIGYPANNAQVDKYIDDEIAEEALDSAEEAANHIADTTSNNMQAAINAVIATAIAAGISLSRSEVAREAGNNLGAVFANRISTIATTEVQGAAETGKWIEIQALDRANAEYEDYNYSVEGRTKTWVAILDDRTRDWHAEADEQTVPINQPFIVNGEEMMRPRDGSMGASADNLINCRCDCVYN
jgi:hypothetical protein